jgi:hypothetical protein
MGLSAQLLLARKHAKAASRITFPKSVAGSRSDGMELILSHCYTAVALISLNEWHSRTARFAGPVLSAPHRVLSLLYRKI